MIPRYLKRTRTDSSLPGASAAEFCWPRGPATATGCTSTTGRITTAAQTVPGHPATSAGRRGRTADVTWLKTDDRFPEHRKIRRLTDAAYRLHHTAMCACAKDETDGLVTEADLADMEHGQRLRKHIDALVSAGLWEPVKDGWLIHDFLDYNPSHASLVTKRAADRERQERYRKGRPQQAVTEVSRRDIRVSHAFVTPPVTAPRPVPDPTRPVPVPNGVISPPSVGGSPNPNRPVSDAPATAHEGHSPAAVSLGIGENS